MEKEYTFQVNGDASEAQKMVQRIRVELSRARAKVMEQGGMLKPFKIILVDIDERKLQGRTVSYVTLLKTISNNGKKMMLTQQFMRELGDFL